MSYRDITGRTAYLWIYDEWIASRPRQGAVVVECGVALGKSLAYLCERLDAAGRDDVQVFAVDPWAGTHRNGEQQVEADAAGGDFTLYTRSMLANAPRAFERIRVVRATSMQACALWRHIDLCILDDEHTYEAVRDELSVYDRRSAWIGGDDHCADYPGVERACTERWGKGGPPGTTAGYEVRTHGGPWDHPRQYEWGTWLHRGDAARMVAA